MKIKDTVTGRGFSLLEFDDYYGEQCSLQQSSLASQNAIWFGVKKVNPIIMNEEEGWVDYKLPEEVKLFARMHLTQDMVKELLPVLQRFADTGYIHSDSDDVE